MKPGFGPQKRKPLVGLFVGHSLFPTGGRAVCWFVRLLPAFFSEIGRDMSGRAGKKGVRPCQPIVSEEMAASLPKSSFPRAIWRGER